MRYLVFTYKCVELNRFTMMIIERVKFFAQLNGVSLM